MKPSKLSQLGYNHAMEGYPYLWNLDRDHLSRDELREYARAYLNTRPTGLAAEQKQYPGNIRPAREDADKPDTISAIFDVIAKCFVGGKHA